MKMSYTIKIMLPIITQNLRDLHFQGYIFIEKLTVTIYITSYKAGLKGATKTNKKENAISGFCLCCSLENRSMKRMPYNYFLLNEHLEPCLNNLVIHGHEMKQIDDCIILLYDYNEIKNSETMNEAGESFEKLQMLVQNDNKEFQNKCMYLPLLEKSFCLSATMFGQHFLNYVNLLIWLISTLRLNKKVRIKQGNLVLAIFMDLILGYLILKLLPEDKKELSSMLMGLLEKLVNSLYTLLKWLMGAPAGLKLNNAFNKMLGNYFSYHIQLWWLFLDVSGEKLDTILHICHYLGYLGLTFQAAIVSDMICVATFHSYCIYVYAARLFNIQISGLIALLRLFVGRKFNPLRGGIDSCEYTNQELFVGTVAFTILLLLLPTTAMYYIVFIVKPCISNSFRARARNGKFRRRKFAQGLIGAVTGSTPYLFSLAVGEITTGFRLLSLVVQYILAKLIYVIQILPLYVIILWTVKSPKLAGNVLIEVVPSKKSSPLVLRVKLITKSIPDLVLRFRPPVELPKQVEWTNLLSNIFTGKQII